MLVTGPSLPTQTSNFRVKTGQKVSFMGIFCFYRALLCFRLIKSHPRPNYVTPNCKFVTLV